MRTNAPTAQPSNVLVTGEGREPVGCVKIAGGLVRTPLIRHACLDGCVASLLQFRPHPPTPRPFPRPLADFGLARVFQAPVRPLHDNGVVVTIWCARAAASGCKEHVWLSASPALPQPPTPSVRQPRIAAVACGCHRLCCPGARFWARRSGRWPTEPPPRPAPSPAAGTVPPSCCWVRVTTRAPWTCGLQAAFLRS